MNANRASWAILGASLLLLVACSPLGGATPQLIGSHPLDNPPPMDRHQIVYTAELTLEVSNVDRAADRAAELAYDRGGYLVSSYVWHQADEKHATLRLAVPVSRFDSLREALLGLGRLIGEVVSGEPKPLSAYGADYFTEIVVHLRPGQAWITWPSIGPSGWNPAYTFQRAFGVIAAIFAFVVDILIWVVVVGGPFVALGWGARALWRRLRKT